MWSLGASLGSSKVEGLEEGLERGARGEGHASVIACSSSPRSAS